MQIIIGLGNPGEKYGNTRHNIGFRILDKIAKKLEVTFRLKKDFKAEVAEIDFNNTVVKLIKPQTFMNDSGQAVVKIKNFYKVSSRNILVVHDDVDLALGKIRIQLDGSSAGHKGIQSIIDATGNDFWRVRIGVGKSEKIPTEVWVLKEFSADKKKHLELIIDKIADFMVKSLGSQVKEETITVEE